MGGPDSPTALPLVQYWNAEPPPDYIAELLASFDALNPGRPHLVFSETSAAAFVEEHHGPREAAAFRACAVPAMQADYFRYCAIHTLGGIYCDADARCVAPLRPLLDTTGSGTLFRRTTTTPAGTTARAVINGFFAFGRPGHPLLGLAVEIATANVELRVGESVWAATGPGIFTGLALLLELGSFEAFAARASGTPWEPFADQLRASVGDHARVADAFEDVAIAPFEEMARYLASSGPMPYKDGADHWVNYQPSIFR